MSDNHDDVEPIGERIIRPANGQEQPREQHIDEQFRDEWRELRAQGAEQDQERPQTDPTVNVWKPGSAKGWQPSSTWPSLNMGADAREVTPRRQDTDQVAEAETKPKKRRRWTFRRVLLALVVLIALALIGWDIAARVSGNESTANPSEQGKPNSSTAKAAPVPAKVLRTALTYERLIVTEQGAKWCPMTANPPSCLKVFGTPQKNLGTFKTSPKVISAAMVPGNNGSAPTQAAVFVGYHVDGRAQAQEDVFVIRLADHKIVGSDLAINDDQAAAGPAQLGAAIMSDPNSVDGADTW